MADRDCLSSDVSSCLVERYSSFEDSWSEFSLWFGQRAVQKGLFVFLVWQQFQWLVCRVKVQSQGGTVLKTLS